LNLKICGGGGGGGGERGDSGDSGESGASGDSGDSGAESSDGETDNPYPDAETLILKPTSMEGVVQLDPSRDTELPVVEAEILPVVTGDKDDGGELRRFLEAAGKRQATRQATQRPLRANAKPAGPRRLRVFQTQDDIKFVGGGRSSRRCAHCRSDEHTKTVRGVVTCPVLLLQQLAAEKDAGGGLAGQSPGPQ